MSTIITTPDGIQYARLAALRGAVKLESLGLRHSRIRSVRKLAAIEMGLKPTAKAADVIAALKTRMDELLTKVKEQNP